MCCFRKPLQTVPSPLPGLSDHYYCHLYSDPHLPKPTTTNDTHTHRHSTFGCVLYCMCAHTQMWPDSCSLVTTFRSGLRRHGWTRHHRPAGDQRLTKLTGMKPNVPLWWNAISISPAGAARSLQRPITGYKSNAERMPVKTTARHDALKAEHQSVWYEPNHFPCLDNSIVWAVHQVALCVGHLGRLQGSPHSIPGLDRYRKWDGLK